MTTPTKTAALALLTIATAFSRTSNAQDVAPALQPAQQPPAQQQPAAPPTEISPLPAAPSGAPSMDERLAELQMKLDALESGEAETRGIVDKLARLKLNGYVQGRYEWHQDAHFGVVNGAQTETTQFLVRRGRLKAVYEGTNAEYLLQIDATGSGVVLKDAEATFVDTWTPANIRITVGQFKWPFGYEIIQSSADREMPERSLIIRTLFPGERDRGLRVTARQGVLRLAFGVVNGTGTQDPVYTKNDSNSFKDVVGRLGADFGPLAFGVSGYYGHKLATQVKADKVSGTDANADGKLVGTELTLTPGSTTYDRFRVYRIGADAQTYIDVPGVGGLALKGELIYARDTNLDFQGVAADSAKDKKWWGWYVVAVQNVGNRVGAVVRVDQMRVDYKAKNAAGAATPASDRHDTTTTLGGGLLYHVSGNLKASVIYEHPFESGALASVDNDIFTAQLQARF